MPPGGSCKCLLGAPASASLGLLQVPPWGACECLLGAPASASWGRLQVPPGGACKRLLGASRYKSVTPFTLQRVSRNCPPSIKLSSESFVGGGLFFVRNFRFERPPLIITPGDPEKPPPFDRALWRELCWRGAFFCQKLSFRQFLLVFDFLAISYRDLRWFFGIWKKCFKMTDFEFQV